MTRIRLDRAAVLIHDLCSHPGLCGEAAVGVFINADALRYEARTCALSRIVARVVVLKCAAVDRKARPASSITAIIAIQREAIRIAAAFLLLDGEVTSVDRDFTGERIDCTDIANVIASVDSQLGVLDIICVIGIHIQCKAVIYFRLECAAASSIINGQVAIVTHRDQRPCTYALIPNIRSIADGLAIQVKRDGLVFDDQRFSKVNIAQQRDGGAAARRVDGSLKGRIFSTVDLSDFPLVRQRGSGQQAEREAKRQQNG